MYNYRRFYIVFSIVLFGIPLGIALFNIAIDPYNLINSPSLVGVNKTKIAQGKHVRLFKAVEITRIKPITIFLGTSRAATLDPTHPALASNQPAYNLALVGATMYEEMRYFQHAIANQPNLKEVIIGVDFFSFNKLKESTVDFNENRLGKSGLTWQDAINTSFSLDSFNTSLETLNFNRRTSSGKSLFINGMAIHHNNVSTNKPMLNIFKETLRLDLQGSYTNFQFSEKSLEHYKTIADTCKQHRIALKVFIPPSHVTDLEAIRAARLWSGFEQWKREIVKIAPVWDFSGYNSITTEPISNNMKNYRDSSHHRKEINDLILNRLFQHNEEKVPRDFGFLTTPANIESHLVKIRVDRETWVKNNPDVVKLVEDLKSQVEKRKQPDMAKQ
jgi:hypothetical protein